MAAPRTFFISLCGLFLLLYFCCGSTTSSSRRTNQERCGFKAQAGVDGRRLAVAFRADNCSLNYPLGKHVIHEVTNISFSHLACEDQAAVVVHWSASPLGTVCLFTCSAVCLLTRFSRETDFTERRKS